MITRSIQRYNLALLGLLILAWCAPAMASAPSTQPYADTQSALSPAGAQASYVSALWWRTLWLLVGVYVIVVGLALIAVWRRRVRLNEQLGPVTVTPRHERRLTIAVSFAMALTIAILFVLLVGDFIVGNKSRALASEPNPIMIQVIGHQWFWEITYQDANTSLTVNDANEIHVPVGRPVRLELKSGDVIHSFWAPNIAGKKDLIPGHPTSLTVRAEREGTFWGQCAEFCGYQHAKMRFAFIVQSPSAFEEWLSAARQSAPAPQTDLQKRGLQIFLGRTCSTCHTIQGTQAGGRLGPNLTHIASRATIASGSLPNSMGHLAGWIVDPQGIKPGTRMPQNQLSGDDLQALLEYLESLK